MMMAVHVMLYSLTTCPWCRKTKQFFSDRGVPFSFLDVDTAALPDREKATATIRELTGSLQYPTVIVNGLVAQGYVPDQFADMLHQAGWTALA
jgi:glutaredoxin